MKRTILLCILLPFILAHQALAQTSNAQANAQPTVETVIKVLNIRSLTAQEVVQITKNESEVEKAIASGRASLAADVRIVQQSGLIGELKSGQRIPIQTASLPVSAVQPTGQQMNRTSGLVSPVVMMPFAEPRIEYENTGISASVLPSAETDGTISLKVKIELSNISSAEPTLTPSFWSRVLSNTVRVKPGEMSLLAWDIAPERSSPTSSSSGAAGRNKPVEDSFVILVTAKLLDR